MKNVSALCAAALFLTLGCSHTKPEPSPPAADHPANPTAPEAALPVPTTYTCPEHPRVMQAESGDCPICGAKLVPSQSRNTSPLRGVAPEHEGHHQ